MRTLGRRAAIGATAVALGFAATGSSLAAVRSTRDEGGMASGLAVPAPQAVGGAATGRSGSGGTAGTGGSGGTAGTGTDAGTLAPTADGAFAPSASIPSLPGAVGPAAGPAPGPSPARGLAAPEQTPAPSAGGGAPAASPAGSPAGEPALPSPTTARPPTATTLGPAAGPIPTTAPGRPASVGCPSDSGQGALPVPVGKLRAVDFTLPWPGSPLVLLPQVSSVRPSGTTVKIAESSFGGLSGDGDDLTVAAPEAPGTIRYALRGEQTAAFGSIAFTAPSNIVANVPLQGCRDRSLTLYDMARSTHEGQPLRIVGTVAPSGEVAVSDDGGTARFRAGPGTHRIVLVTANDAGAAGPLVVTNVIVP